MGGMGIMGLTGARGPNLPENERSAEVALQRTGKVAAAAKIERV
jgi:hypothetical protein